MGQTKQEIKNCETKQMKKGNRKLIEERRAN
jgi:hypothetical protein